MKNYRYIGIVLIALSLVSCKKWLDVQPEDKFTETQVYSTPNGFYQSLNGVYLQMSKPSLYGANLTMVVPELLAQNYNIASNHTYYYLSSYNYTDLKTLDKSDDIWTSAYVAIANVNSLLGNLDKYSGVLTTTEDSLIRGEAIALRAFLHFDILRLFGPMYNTADSILPSIPYYTKSNTNFNQFLPANNIMDSITLDLATAERLLARDPILIYGVRGDLSGNANQFFQTRNRRMNYYAVKALQAKVYMYRGAKSQAYTAATFVIQQAKPLFPWVKPTDVITNAANPNRTFTSELLFALQSMTMYQNYQSYYSPTLQDGSILAPLDGRLKTLMEESTYPNDYRLAPDWAYPTVGGKAYRTFYKYADIASQKDSTIRFLLPMIRISEMYYIAAETATNTTEARSYLDSVRYNRGIQYLSTTAVLATEIKKEYNKEFYGEGQYFYYLKRTNTTAIPNGSAASGNITMDKTKYVFPIPTSETDYH